MKTYVLVQDEPKVLLIKLSLGLMPKKSALMKHCPDFSLGPSLPIPDSSSIGLKYKTASLLSHVLKSWLECLLHENDELKILQRDPLVVRM